MDEDTLRKAAQEFGRRGGKRTASLYGSDHYRKMQSISAANKRKKK